MFSEQELSFLVLQGWIAGPQETEEQFIQRIGLYCSRSSLHEGNQKLYRLYGIFPSWIEVHYSNRGLSPWQGGAAWIDGDRLTLQLRSAFQHKAKACFYSREEILAHESLHAVRMAFQEPIFEEFFTYQTASTPFRKYWGPFFQTSLESTLFLGLVAALSVANVFFPIVWGWAVFGIILGGGTFRLWKAHRSFRTCQHRLASLTGSLQTALQAMLCMTDKEIIKCATLSGEEIKQYFQEKPLSLRLRQLKSLTRIFHKHSSQFDQSVLPDAEEKSELRVKLTLPRIGLKAEGETDGHKWPNGL